mmetsp:Transcript_32402/g.52484  ORF Transcript_32402/g.52484 Transcript_32402/m.52484 type:complete len:220 (+) Transcript_32402:345-1004(+)
MRLHNIAIEFAQCFHDLQALRHIFNLAFALINGVSDALHTLECLAQRRILRVRRRRLSLQILQQQHIARNALNGQNEVIGERQSLLAFLAQIALQSLRLSMLRENVENALIAAHIVNINREQWRKLEEDCTQMTNCIIVIFIVVVTTTHLRQKLFMQLNELRHNRGDRLLIFARHQLLRKYRLDELVQQRAQSFDVLLLGRYQLALNILSLLCAILILI